MRDRRILAISLMFCPFTLLFVDRIVGFSTVFVVFNRLYASQKSTAQSVVNVLHCVTFTLLYFSLDVSSSLNCHLDHSLESENSKTICDITTAYKMSQKTKEKWSDISLGRHDSNGK